MAEVFGSSTEAMDWMWSNCWQCKKHGQDIDDCTCPLVHKIELAMLFNPEPPPEFFEPYGFEGGKIPERCSQIEPVTEEDAS